MCAHWNHCDPPPADFAQLPGKLIKHTNTCKKTLACTYLHTYKVYLQRSVSLDCFMRAKAKPPFAINACCSSLANTKLLLLSWVVVVAWLHSRINSLDTKSTLARSKRMATECRQQQCTACMQQHWTEAEIRSTLAVLLALETPSTAFRELHKRAQMASKAEEQCSRRVSTRIVALPTFSCRSQLH